MLTLFGTYVLAISVGAGAALINDLFFILSLKHHKLKHHELVTLRQLNNIQLFLIVWIILVEITMLAIQIQVTSLDLVPGASYAKLIIELVVLFCALLLRQVHFPALTRHQNTYGHLSDSFLEHSNELISTCAISLISWFFIVLVTSSMLNDSFVTFGFSPTLFTFAAVALLTSWLFVYLKNHVLHRKHKK